MKKFNVKEVELKGSNLVEASAGTGKTYSVALLVLRLIVEAGVPIEKILMVTFTNAAVAELELRIRKFVRLGFHYASSDQTCDQEIMDLVNKAGKEACKTGLKTALQSLDNLSVMTIHSFCQKTIDEFTFETNQSFGYEIVTDDSDMLRKAANKFVREVLNTLEYEEFIKLNENLNDVSVLGQLLSNHLQGMKFMDAENHVELARIVKNEDEKLAALKKAVEDNFDKIQALDISKRTDLGKSRASAELFLPEFIKYCCQKKEYISNFEFIYYPYGKEYAEACDKISLVCMDFFKKAGEEIERIKKHKGFISYNDQIKTIHSALGNMHFKTRLKEKYDAVFIDEFQDTDKHQYEIFSEVFDGKTIFYIGDPKQSIYGWRGADLDTYKAAKDRVKENVHTLERNYRSTPRLLEALEKIMYPSEDFNMFLDESIRFESVKAGNNKLGDIKLNEKDVPPVTLWKFNSNDFDSSYERVAREVLMLLSGNYTLNGNKITPRDIGILTRTNNEARATKKALAKLGIPSVLRDDVRVLSSDEGVLVRCLIIAVLNPKRGEIFRVLNLPQFGYTPVSIKSKEGEKDTSQELVELQMLDEEKHFACFLELRNILQKEGVYNMIARFLDIYGIRKRCMNDVEGQRVLTNINHIAEILHRLERKARLSPDELVVWLQRSQDESNEEYQLRVESDENAVQISSIHKAKGLQYNIVFAPFLSMFPRAFRSGKVISFKKPLPADSNGLTRKEYFFTLKFSALDQADQNLKKEQDEQENRRLIYVTLTRAVYKCYISLIPKESSRGKPVESSLSEILKHYPGDTDLIEEIDFSQTEARIEDATKKPKKWEPTNQDHALSFTPRTPTLTTEEVKVPKQIHSYSDLNKKHFSTPFEKAELGNGKNYEQFIFQELGRGANVGTALHSIFERLDFNRTETWEKTLRESAKYYKGILKEEWMEHFKTLVQHTMGVDISLNGETFRLSQITRDRMLPELQFYFSMEEVNKQKINELMGEEAELAGDADLQGLMHGFVDLVFEHNGKYYILDWKSNHLGNSLESYNNAGLDAAMKGSNYNLQYMIYTLAVKHWLQSRIPYFDYEQHFGGVIYLFLRGLRQGSRTGIFTRKPACELIEKMGNAFIS